MGTTTSLQGSLFAKTLYKQLKKEHFEVFFLLFQNFTSAPKIIPKLS